MKINKIVIYLITYMLMSNYFLGVAAEQRNMPPDNILNHYIHWRSFPGKNDIVKKLKILPANIDINGDGFLDWFLEDPSSCGQIGCSGIIYLYTNNKSNSIKDTMYCISGDSTDESDLDYFIEKNMYKDIKCNSAQDQIIEWKNN